MAAKGAAPYYTVDELKSIFKMSDDKTIASNFGERLVIHEQQSVLPSEYLVDVLGFSPTEPFLTRMEAMRELGIGFGQIKKLVNLDLLHVFKVKDRRGSSRFFLRRDVDDMKKTLIEYDNSVALLDDYNHRLRGFLTRMIDFDYEHKKRVCHNEEDYQLFQKYILHHLDKADIAKEMELTTERIRQRVSELTKRFDLFCADIDGLMLRQSKIIEENNQLRAQVEEYKKYVENLNGIPLLNDSAIKFIRIFKDIPIGSLPFSSRTLHRLVDQLLIFDADSRPSEHKNGKWQDENYDEYCAIYCTLYYLLRFPIKRLNLIGGFGKSCWAELDNFFKEYGLSKNNSYVTRDITANNVMSLIEDERRLLLLLDKNI